MAAQAKAITPRSVLFSRRSVRIRASTGNAVIDIETLKNSANAVNGTSLLESVGYSHSANAAPSEKGTMMLACEIAKVTCPCLRRIPAFSSKPTTNM